ncbi:MAG: hypothetical protein LBG72_09720 [Spirochaetaceae bacterium]|jgi:hypothetical protein|nr:hypothetical protein [Spirochaetaceae bacterium]
MEKFMYQENSAGFLTARRNGIFAFLLILTALFASCEGADKDEEQASQETPGGGEQDGETPDAPVFPATFPQSLVGTYWYWPSLQLFFISEDRVALYSAGAYYPYSGYPFLYTYNTPGYAYSYTWKPGAKSGSINDLGEYQGGHLGSFKLREKSGESDAELYFPNYKGYGHGADFNRIRPAPAGGFEYGALPPTLVNTVWMAEIPAAARTVPAGAAAPGGGAGGGSLIILAFVKYDDTPAQAYITRTWNTVTEAQKRRVFDFSVDGTAGNIEGIGNFTVVDGGSDSVSFEDFAGEGSLRFTRIN